MLSVPDIGVLREISKVLKYFLFFLLFLLEKEMENRGKSCSIRAALNAFCQAEKCIYAYIAFFGLRRPSGGAQHFRLVLRFAQQTPEP